MLLFIDTSDYDNARLALVGKVNFWHHFKSDNLSEQLLLEIKKFCRKNKINFKQLTRISVVVGPGGFSRIRTGIATANALAYVLNLGLVPLTKDQIPVDLSVLQSFPAKKMVKPAYGREPNITMRKS